MTPTVWLLDKEQALSIIRIDRTLQVNSSIYGRSPLLLLSVAATEMALNVCLLAFLPIFCSVVWKSGVVHRNFRLQLCTSAVYYSLGVLGRCVLFYAQYTGGSDDEILWVFIPAQLARTAATVFAVSLVLCFAFERTVATYFWSWYEKGSPSTICIYFITECMNMTTLVFSCYLKYKYSLDYMFAHTLCIAIAGFIAFGSVYSKNLKMLNRIKCGAQVGSYSVARTFQVKENVEVLRYMSWMGRGWFLASTSCFIFYGYFWFGPTDNEVSRALSYNIFEIGVALNFTAFYALSITGNKHIFKQFCELGITRSIILRMKRNIHSAPKYEIRSETDHYFMQFNRSWMSCTA